MWMLRSRRKIRREAAAWVARLGGGAGEREHAAFHEWYDADPRHGEAYDRLAAIWSAAGRLEVPASSGLPVNTAGRRRFAYAVAASLAALIAVAFLLARGAWFDGSSEVASYAAAQGEVRRVVLPDGSRVLLDAGSRIELSYSSAERRLLLSEGRARFSVAHESRPFIVEAGASQVVATGTVFDVSLLNDRLAVVMLEGSVELRSAAASHTSAVHRLTAGQGLIVHEDGRTEAVPTPRRDTAWPGRMLEFDNTPLADAVETANRYGRVRIRLADEEIRGLRVSGSYRAGDTAGLARGLAAAFELRVATEPDGTLTLSRRAR